MKRFFSEIRALTPFVLVLMSGMALVSLAEESPQAPASTPSASPSPAGSGTPPQAEGANQEHSRREQSACLADASSVDDLKKTRETLEARQKAVAAREAELAIKERALKEELKRLEIVRDEISKGSAAKKKESEERVAKLVETLENMSPKSAAQLLAGIEEGLSVSSMSRLSTVKLAKILSAMEPVRSARLTELLGGVKPRQAESESDRMNLSAKGGERNNGRNENRNAVAAVSTADGGKSPTSQSSENGRQPASTGSAGGSSGTAAVGVGSKLR